MKNQSWDDNDKDAPRTPWGKAQGMTYHGEGVVEYFTAGHGGFKLDRKRNAMVPKPFRQPGGWYEEDCEWAMVALTFPHLFKEKELENAIKTLKDYYPHEYTEVTRKPVIVEESYKLRTQKFQADTFHKYVTRAAWGDCFQTTPKGQVVVLGKRAADGSEAYFLVPKEQYKPDSLVLDDFPGAKADMIP